MEWNYTDMPKDGTRILRWHNVWRCPIAVFYKEGEGHLEWIEASLSNSWPEGSFAPDAWVLYPEAPVGGKVSGE